MPNRPTKPLTVGSLVASTKGVNLLCKCGHKTALLPAQIAAMAHPASSLADFKHRFRCTMCGRSGASDDIRMTTFAVAPVLGGAAPARPGARH